MNISHPNVTYSSIVKVGEEALELENKTGKKVLKLHRGVMDVTNIEIDSFMNDFTSKKLITQYTANDGLPQLITSINDLLRIEDCRTIIVPGGMASLDLAINSLSDEKFHIPKYHWGSWNKILKIHKKTIETYNEFDLDSFRPKDGVIMMCFPSNPTGYQPSMDKINGVLEHAKLHGLTVILDLPYYHLFNPFDDAVANMFGDNVILLSSFSKSFGLSGFRIGYISTKSPDLYETLRIRSLYKYNSISVLPQVIINRLIHDYFEKGSISSLSVYQKITRFNIASNIQYLVDNNLLMAEYPEQPIGPFAIIKKTQKELLDLYISSVPLSKFTLDNSNEHLSRISVAINHLDFVKYLSGQYIHG
jgi:aspartate/methionine/tyrosine aminotransferase